MSERFKGIDDQHQSNEKAVSVVSEDKSALEKGKEPMKEKNDVSGMDVVKKWKRLKEREWIEQDKYIANIDKQIKGLKPAKAMTDVAGDLRTTQTIYTTGPNIRKRNIEKKRGTSQGREDSFLN